MPFLKALALSASVIPLVSATSHLPARTEAGIDPSRHPEIVRVDCLTGRGSAVRVSPNILLSVHHVTSGQGCFIGGKPFVVRHVKGDFSILRMEDKAATWMAIDCRGFVAGRDYIAIGYARGLDTITTVDLIGSGKIEGEWSILHGVFTVVPGQSGGAVIDAKTGKIVGVVNVFDMRGGRSGSVALKGTAACNF